MNRPGATRNRNCKHYELISGSLNTYTVHTQRNGLPLTRTELNASYVIIRHNVRTYRSAGVVAVIGGKSKAELELKNFEDSQESSDRLEGWRYFIEKTDLKAGTDPAEATQHRQDELEQRESKAMLETPIPNFPPPRRR